MRETDMAAVSWRYPQDEFTALQRQNAEAEARANVTAAGGIDVSSLRFRYRISGDFPPWRPAQAFDDGRKSTSSSRPASRGRDPPLFIIGPTGEAELVVKGSTYIVDGLFAAAELRSAPARNRRCGSAARMGDERSRFSAQVKRT